ncbi:MAG: hypothetical protein DWQ37_16210 [Planctomycetota bacterium]|mgnify:CR=1 FL=1|nr:MAG: hypothetical protein DWQ37_16210 [Planctomycetota bacterium]
MSRSLSTTQPAGSTLIEDWQLLAGHCSEQFVPITGTPDVRRRIAQWEAEQIACFTNPRYLTCVRARALRYVAEMRGCSIRQISQFFDISAEVVVASLSLLAEPARPQVKAVPVPVSESLVKAA